MPDMNAVTQNPLFDVIEQIVREKFKGIDIESVNVSMDRDGDGDRVLRVLVVYGAKAKLDMNAAKSLSREIVESQDVRDIIPLLFFRSSSDHKRLSAAA